ncbi:MAG: exodeoxyribonuclease VII small subunit [Candidatus Dadabacteria bacterium]|jgi:exodeoxyribonuclease VII small subunit|nr:MAG: exodeoxyribonuclease VII small subunit [Thermodesulfobacteriales bacterium]
MKSFEDSMNELKEIVEKLQSGNLPLEESIKLFQEGTKLIAFSHKKLDQIQKKVKILVEDKDGELITKDFNTED